MQELKFTQNHPQAGLIKLVLRVIGRKLYYKFNNSQYAEQVISQLQSKGALIQKGRGWIMVDMFAKIPQDFVKLGDVEFKLSETTPEELEGILAKFYIIQYTKAGFTYENMKNG